MPQPDDPEKPGAPQIVVAERPDAAPEDAAARAEREELFKHDITRLDKLRDALHKVVVGAIWIVGFGVFACIIIRLWHLVAPACWQWLDAGRIQQIDHFLLSGALGGILARYLGHALPANGSKG